MRVCLFLYLSFAALAAVELPTLTRPDGPPSLTYDLGASAPWMPLLWDRIKLTLPAGATRCRLTATMKTGTGRSADASDLLGLREGHRLTLTGTTLTVDGLAGTWSGVRAYPAALTADITAPADRLVEAVILLCRQMHYANLGGERALTTRQVGITLTSDGTATSAELLIDLNEASVDQPPKLRFDNVVIPLGGSTAWSLLGWYDGRQPSTALTWNFATLPSGCTATGLVGGVRADLTADLTTTPQPLAWFSTAQPQLQAGATLGTFTCRVAAQDGVTLASATTFNVVVTPPSGGLLVIGDFPFAISASTAVNLRASRSDVRFLGCRPHPAIGGYLAIPTPFTVTTSGDAIRVQIEPVVGVPEIAGCAVFEAGGSAYSLPYRVRFALGTPD